MKKINTNNWQEFRVGDIFSTISKGKRVPTGASVLKKELKEHGTTPRITVSGVNNGIIGFFDILDKKNDNYRVYSNFISVSFLGTVFYQRDEASLDMKVHCLKPVDIELNEYIGQFLVSAIKSSLRYYSYADQISSTVLPNLYIMLPSTTDHKPDWKYMEQYMQRIENKVTNDISLIIRSLVGGEYVSW